MGAKKERHKAKVAEREKSAVAVKGAAKRKFLIVAVVMLLLFLVPIAISIAASYLENNSLSPNSYQTELVQQEEQLTNFNVNVQVVREPKAQQVATTTADVITYYHNDHNGQPEYMTDESGSIVWRREQQSFGEETLQRGTVVENLRMPGQYHDAETGLNQNRHRDYSDKLGRYVEADPIGLKGGINPYTYANDNPINQIDPDGLAYFAKRPLNFGKATPPTSWGSNTHNTETLHEHLFFEDGLSPSNLGFFGDPPNGQVRPDDHPVGYGSREGNYDDCVMREAVKWVSPGKYGFVTNNCQDWATEVRKEYNALLDDPYTQGICNSRKKACETKKRK